MPTQDELDKRFKEAETKVKIAEKEKLLAEHLREKLKAELTPFGTDSKITAPAGDVTPTKDFDFIETQILAYEAVKLVVGKIAEILKKITNDKNLVIYNEKFIQAVNGYDAVFQQFKELINQHQRQHAENENAFQTGENVFNPTLESNIVGAESLTMATALALPTVIGTAINSIAELVNLFRSDVKIQTKLFEVKEDLIVSYLFKAFEFNQLKLYYPSLYIPVSDSDATKELLQTLARLRENNFQTKTDLAKFNELSEKISAQITKNETKISDTETGLKEKQTEATKLAENDEKLSVLKTEIEILEKETGEIKSFNRKLEIQKNALSRLIIRNDFLQTATNQLVDGLETPDSTTKVTPLMNLWQIAALHSLLRSDKTLILRIIATASGTTSSEKGVIFNTEISHSGGASVYFQLFDHTGRIVVADTLQHYYDWKTSGEIRDIANYR